MVVEKQRLLQRHDVRVQGPQPIVQHLAPLFPAALGVEDVARQDAK